MYWPGDGQSWGMLIPGERSHRIASRSGSGYGSGLRSSALTTLKIAVVGADAERERRHDDEGEAAWSCQCAERVAEILPDRMHAESFHRLELIPLL